MNSEIENFIGVFDNAFDEQYCQSVIDHFEKLNDFHKVNKRADFFNQPGIKQQNDIYGLVRETDSTFISSNEIILREFNIKLQECYELYKRKYPILDDMSSHRLNLDTKIQKTVPGEGYHVWHCEHSGVKYGKRLLMVIVYLNEVEGGETEFLYQHKRVAPKTGRLMICPAGFTHTHRGNPPLEGCKYILNGWIEFIQ